MFKPNCIYHSPRYSAWTLLSLVDRGSLVIAIAIAIAVRV
jgi:hypothetical protein